MNKMQGHVCRKALLDHVSFSAFLLRLLFFHFTLSMLMSTGTESSQFSSVSPTFLRLAFVLCPDPSTCSCSLVLYSLTTLFSFPLHQSWRPLTVFQLLCGVQGVEGCQGSIGTLCCRLACSFFLVLLPVRGKEAASPIGLLIKRARLIECTGLLECTRLQRKVCVYELVLPGQ